VKVMVCAPHQRPGKHRTCLPLPFVIEITTPALF
jgi:hypothetical protein